MYIGELGMAAECGLEHVISLISPPERHRIASLCILHIEIPATPVTDIMRKFVRAPKLIASGMPIILGPSEHEVLIFLGLELTERM